MKTIILLLLISFSVLADPISNLKINPLPDIQRNAFCQWNKVCLEGHVYFYYKCSDAVSLSPKLTNSGQPIRCTPGKRVCVKRVLGYCKEWKWDLE